MLTSHPEINALYLASAGVRGACQAMDDLGLLETIKIISHDTTPEICSLMNKGAILATIDQQPFMQGSLPLDIMLDLVGMGIQPTKDRYYTKMEIKIKENI